MLRKLNVESFVSVPPPPVPWVAYPSLACKGMLSVVSAKPGMGKTWLSLAVATALSSQRKIAGMSNGGKPHQVIYIDAENGEGVLRRRIYALKCNPSLLDIYDAPGFTLDNKDELYMLIKMSNYPSLVVFDSFAKMWHGDENDKDAVTTVLGGVREILQETGCAGMLLHHNGKNSRVYRGSGAVAAECEIVIQMNDKDSCVYDRVLTWEKCRPDAAPDQFYFNLREIIGNTQPCNCMLCSSYEQE